ncbi:Rv2175c family DNA-binding protein [Kineosporia sp. R_H_3]|uniref:Rv2175c family DNA-binding protein n=1 Tax=Kineosporia sp. R_H_3 TaxID=1961848 RepID=UPI000B4ACD1E|nr:Rv2175c family DNA-binding protein [Kineosporia sp. R_H_3]
MTETARPTDPADHGLDALVDAWLPLPDVAEQLGLDVGKVRRLLQDGALLAVRRGERRILSVPALLLIEVEGRMQPLPELKGTISVLADAGYDAAESLRWLFTPDESLPGSPVEALRAGHKTEIRRRAQALAF